LEEGTTENYKPGSHARFMVAHMSQSRKTLLESISKLTGQLNSIEKKIDKFSGDIGVVKTKVNLVMTLSSLV
jgi:hypothetical protein